MGTKAKSLILAIVAIMTLAGCPNETACEPVRNPVLPVTEYSPVNEALKSRILAYLTLLETDAAGKILVGQNVGHADWSGSYHYSEYSQAEYALTGKLAAMLGIDLGWDDFASDYSQMLLDIETHWTAGGLVTISAHMPNPKTLGDVRDKNFSHDDYRAILTEGSKTRERWLTYLSNIANIFQVLKEKHVIVLWRPLHEMNGGWFWWGNDIFPPSSEQFTALWRDMYAYFLITRRLDNLLWVYGPNYRYSLQMPQTDFYYPGSDYVNIVGLDYYNDGMDELDANTGYERLEVLGKPMGICEIGPAGLFDGTFDNTLYEGITANYPRVSYMLVWHSWPGYKVAIHDNLKPSQLMNSPQIITLDEVDY